MERILYLHASCLSSLQGPFLLKIQPVFRDKSLNKLILKLNIFNCWLRVVSVKQILASCNCPCFLVIFHLENSPIEIRLSFGAALISAREELWPQRRPACLLFWPFSTFFKGNIWLLSISDSARHVVHKAAVMKPTKTDRQQISTKKIHRGKIASCSLS